MLVIRKLNANGSEGMTKDCISTLKSQMPRPYTITTDNLNELADHRVIAAGLGVFYFSNLYHTLERGYNKILNGLIQPYIPKKNHFSTIEEVLIV